MTGTPTGGSVDVLWLQLLNKWKFHDSFLTLFQNREGDFTIKTQAVLARHAPKGHEQRLTGTFGFAKPGGNVVVGPVIGALVCSSLILSLRPSSAGHTDPQTANIVTKEISFIERLPGEDGECTPLDDIAAGHGELSSRRQVLFRGSS